MKSFLRPQLLLCLASALLPSVGLSGVHAAPKKRTPKGSALPAAVRTELPAGCLSVSLFQLAPAPKEKPFLFHLWTAPRRDPAGDGSQVTPDLYKGAISAAEAKAGGLRPSPFVVDVFAPGAKAGQWKYQTSIVSSGTKAPANYALRFLDAKKKEGYVLSETEVLEGRDAPLSYTLDVFPYGWEQGSGPQQIFTDIPGNTSSTTYSFARDANGILQMSESVENMEGPPSKTQRFWNWNSQTFNWQAPS